MNPVFCAVADDDTGATDLAGMLADQGLRTVLLIDLPGDDDLRRWAADHDAVIIGVGTRALPPVEAYTRTAHAVGRLLLLSPRVIEVKYCSTFDSTPEGNIGPSIDAAMDELAVDFTVALPALPVNGRTTYMGYHFVHQQLLSDSPMRNHPLTPMTNAHLVTHLQSQTKRKVGLASHPVTREKVCALRDAGVQIAILDCISDDDLTAVCDAISDLQLITGSSAPAMKLPAIWKQRGWWKESSVPPAASDSTGRGSLIVAGSCSEATRRQNECIVSRGAINIAVDALELAQGSIPEDAVSAAASELADHSVILLTASSTPDQVRAVQQWGRSEGLSGSETGLRIAYSLARTTLAIVERTRPKCLVVAGGETSGAVCRVLELGALEIGGNIDPGVPSCLSLGRFRIPLALKSGNFGSEDFYIRAIRVLES